MLPEVPDGGDEDQPGNEAASADYGCILETDDVAESEDGRTRIYLDNESRLLGKHSAETHHSGGNHFLPETECRDSKIVQSPDTGRDEEDLGLLGAPFTGDKHLCRGGRLGKREQAVLLFTEIPSQGYEEENPEKTPEK